MKWGLMLGGGTALGAVQVPILHTLVDEKGMFSAGAGTSIGANNISMAAQGPEGIHRLMQAWTEVKGARSFQAFRLDVWRGVFSLQRLRRWHDAIGSCENLLCPAYVGVVDLATQQHSMIDLGVVEDVSDRRDLVVASSQQPMINQGRKFQGRWYGDGGIVSVLGRLPWEIVRGLDELHVVACSPVHRGQRNRLREQAEVNSAIEQGVVCFELWMTMVAERDYRWLQQVAFSGVKVFLYAPESWEEVGRPFDAKPATIRRRFEVGRKMLVDPEVVEPCDWAALENGPG